MKKYLLKVLFSTAPDKPFTRNNSTYTFISVIDPYKPNGSVGFERTVVADEAWVRQNLGDIDLKNKELPEFFTAELKGEEKA